jgi:hypothetical protein
MVTLSLQNLEKEVDFMKPTAFVYSSHDRSDYIHREWIVQRALESWDNKTLLHLPWSQDSKDQQEWDFGTFQWFYERFTQYGLKYTPFYWDDNLNPRDVDMLMNWISSVQVLVLGGGNPALGMRRFYEIGQKYYNDPLLFPRLIHQRQSNGLLTVGFSAGADQLSEYMWGAIDYMPDNPYGLGVTRNINVSLHYEPGGGDYIRQTAMRLTHCLNFGLPNDSGIGTTQGYLHSGNMWQLIWFVIDESWDIPEDQWHIKTRAGEKIQHYYPDGRHWAFNGGDMMVRVMSPDSSWQQAWIITNQGDIIDYWDQTPSYFNSIEEILSNY